MRKSIQHRWTWLIAAGFVGIVLGCGGFRNVTPPPAPCPLDVVLIDESIVPEAWYLNMSGEPAARFGVEFEAVFFNSSYGGGIYAVYREWSTRKAKDSYDDFVKSYFSSNDELPEWTAPSELTYQSLVADQVQFGCSTEVGTDREYCQFAAQYDVYIVWFYSVMSEVMTYADFEAVLQEIDRRMTECLSP